jgi:two-component system chemotaxis sensor kinase CheA
MTNDDLQKQLVNDLLIESFEGLDRFDQELLIIESGASTPETMNIIFRVIHTIKGTAGCLGLSRIESLAHVGENLLSCVREGKVGASSELISALLALSDALRDSLRFLEANGVESDVVYSAVIERLQRLQPGAAKPAAAAAFGLFGETNPPIPVAIAASVSAPIPPVALAQAPTNPVVISSRESAAPIEVARPSVSESAIRVDVTQLDKLMNLVGELVLARNQIIQNATQLDPAALLTAAQRLNLITTELQESVMKTRMQPIGNIWGKFPRVVRDLSSELRKQVKLEMVGSETELDRTIIEAIKDPLTHIIRNSIDHGIETPEKRIAKGKPAEGSLVLRAFHEGGQVNIEICDDGAGISVERVKAKALERQLISVEHAARMSEREAMNLIFAPGLSTAEKITNVSGRGVGMDVVKTNIEKIGGSIDVKSERDGGTTLKIKIPLTLAIIPALTVTSRGERFAIPQVSLLELVRLEDEQVNSIENLYGAPVYRLRGQLLPLCYLDKELALHTVRPDFKRHNDAINIVVLEADSRRFGIVVDEVNDTEEIVVKPLGKQLKGLSCFAGATIMGDGKVALILDVLGLAQRANVIGEVRDRALSDDTASAENNGNKQALLVVDSGNGGRVAIPLSAVARLEEIPRARIEKSGRQEVVQYRGEILPLVRVDEFLGASRDSTETLADPMQVVVYAENNQRVGLVVSRITDIVEEAISVRRDARGPGIVGSIVVQDKVTDLLDVAAMLREIDVR